MGTVTEVVFEHEVVLVVDAIAFSLATSESLALFEDSLRSIDFLCKFLLEDCNDLGGLLFHDFLRY